MERLNWFSALKSDFENSNLEFFHGPVDNFGRIYIKKIKMRFWSSVKVAL